MTTQSHGLELAFDIVISGGSFSAPAAALAAARTNPDARILLVEPTDWLGGQATSQGVSAIDNSWFAPAGALMRNNPGSYYPADYLDFLNRLKNAPPSAPGEGFAPNGTAWVSREVFDPRTAAWVLDQQIAQMPNITVRKMTVVKRLTTQPVTDEFGSGIKITSITLVSRTAKAGYLPFSKFLSEELHDWYATDDSADFAKEIVTVVPRDVARGLVVVDASELGDAMVLSGGHYSVGRELSSEALAEDGSFPPMDEDGSQATVYPFCMTDGSTSSETETRQWWLDFEGYYQEQSSSFYRIWSPHTWNTVWTYRRLKLGTTDMSIPHQGDVTMQNWYPGNDYPYGTILLNKTGAAAEAEDWKGAMNLPELAKAEKHAVGWYFWMKEHRTSTWDTHYLHGDDPLNMMDTAHGLSKFPYIRCTRRTVGLHDFRLTGRYLSNTEAQGPYTTSTSWRFYDSVGIANYAVDIHPTKISTGIEPPFEKAAPFYIPLRALGSANVRNLLLAGKLIAGTYVTNAAYRLHPIEWSIGSAAGTAAAMMHAEQVPNYGLLETSALRRLQETIRQNSPISWLAYDAQPVPDQNGEIIVNDLKAFQAGVPFPIEIYHHRAVRARVYHRNVLLGETSTRANGRLLLANAVTSSSLIDFRAECLDAGGNVIDVLRLGVDTTGPVIDDLSSRFSKTGEWTTGTSQPDKYLTSYQYAWGTSVTSVATWRFDVPAAGRYKISVWYPEAFNRATDAPFTVYHAGGATTVRLNQQVNGGKWVELGEFDLAGTPDERVELTNSGIADTTKLVVADAVQVTLVQARVEAWRDYAG